MSHNAAKPREALVRFIAQRHKELVRTISRLSDAQVAFKPREDEWSILEVLAHVAESKRATAKRCKALASGQTPKGFGDEHGEPKTTLIEARVAVEVAHGEVMGFLEDLGPDTNSKAKFRFGDFGEFNCLEVAVLQRIHDTDHLGQIKGIMETEGFPA